MFSSEAVWPKFSKIESNQGLAKAFFPAFLMELCEEYFQVTIVGVVAYLVIRSEIANVIPLMEQNIWSLIVFWGGWCLFKIVLSATICAHYFIVLDYIYQRWEYEKSLRMTRQEIKDEYKNTEGDPLINPESGVCKEKSLKKE